MFSLQERDMEDQSESDQEDLFNFLEESLEATLRSGSESSEPDDHFEDPDVHRALYGSSEAGDGNYNGNLPNVIMQLQKQLLKEYILPPCPAMAPLQWTLDRAETLSLQHYLVWTESHGTVKAYNAHARVLAEATKEEILSLHRVKQLAMNLTGLKPLQVDMCPKSCMAYTGNFQSDLTCSYGHKGRDSGCSERRYKSAQSSRAKSKPRATMLYIPITPIIQAFYANAETSCEMRHRIHCYLHKVQV
jgi:hypothetical protein